MEDLILTLLFRIREGMRQKDLRAGTQIGLVEHNT